MPVTTGFSKLGNIFFFNLVITSSDSMYVSYFGFKLGNNHMVALLEKCFNFKPPL